MRAVIVLALVAVLCANAATVSVERQHKLAGAFKNGVSVDAEEQDMVAAELVDADELDTEEDADDEAEADADVESEDAADVAADAEERASTKGGVVTINGKPIPLTGDPFQALSPGTQADVNAFYHTMLTIPFGGGLLFGSVDVRSSSAASTAVSASVPSSAANKFGKLTIMIPGTGSWGPSAAWVFRAARISQRVVIVYHNAFANPTSLVQASSIEGIAVPSSLAGKIFTMGDYSNRAFLDMDQCTDVLIYAYAAISAAQAKFGFDPMTSQATLIGHSQGSFCVAYAKQRLINAGFPNAVGNLITLGGGLGPIGGPGDAIGLKLLYKFLEDVNDVLGGTNTAINNYLNYVNAVASGQVPEIPALRALVNLGVGSAVGTGRQPYVLPQFKLSSLGLNAIQLIANPFDLASAYASSDPAAAQTDGILPLGLTLAGQKTFQLANPADHSYHIGYYAFVDQIAAQL